MNVLSLFQKLLTSYSFFRSIHCRTLLISLYYTYLICCVVYHRRVLLCNSWLGLFEDTDLWWVWVEKFGCLSLTTSLLLNDHIRLKDDLQTDHHLCVKIVNNATLFLIGDLENSISWRTCYDMWHVNNNNNNNNWTTHHFKIYFTRWGMMRPNTSL